MRTQQNQNDRSSTSFAGCVSVCGATPSSTSRAHVPMLVLMCELCARLPKNTKLVYENIGRCIYVCVCIREPYEGESKNTLQKKEKKNFHSESVAVLCLLAPSPHKLTNWCYSHITPVYTYLRNSAPLFCMHAEDHSTGRGTEWEPLRTTR